MMEKIREAAEHIMALESAMREKAATLRNSNREFPDMLEKGLVIPVPNEKVDGTVAAVDGGLLAQEMHGADIVIARAAAVIFKYENAKLVSHEFWPNAFPESDQDIKIGLDEREILSFRSLFRLRKEIECSIGVMEEKAPQWMLMDGSLLPLTADKPLEESEVFYEYQRVVGLYKKMYKTANEKGCRLLGVIKDSRSKRFTDIVRPAVDVRCSDGFFLNHFLNEGERTSAFKYTSDPRRHPITRDFGADTDGVYAMYLKPVRDDVPLRVEFIGQDFGQVASFINCLSRINKSYAYPAALIEADLRAALDPRELERAQKSLAMHSGMRIAPLRRNSRPFR